MQLSEPLRLRVLPAAGRLCSKYFATKAKDTKGHKGGNVTLVLVLTGLTFSL